MTDGLRNTVISFFFSEHTLTTEESEPTGPDGSHTVMATQATENPKPLIRSKGNVLKS